MKPTRISLRFITLVITMTALAGCEDRPQRWSQSEIEDIAYDAAIDANAGAGDLSAQVSDLQSENEQLRIEIQDLNSRLSQLESKTQSHY